MTAAGWHHVHGAHPRARLRQRIRRRKVNWYDGRFLPQTHSVRRALTCLCIFLVSQAWEVGSHPVPIAVTVHCRSGSIDFEEATPGQRFFTFRICNPLYPGNQIIPRRTPELPAPVASPAKRRLANGGAYTVWSRAWANRPSGPASSMATKAWDSLSLSISCAQHHLPLSIPQPLGQNLHLSNRRGNFRHDSRAIARPTAPKPRRNHRIFFPRFPPQPRGALYEVWRCICGTGDPTSRWPGASFVVDWPISPTYRAHNLARRPAARPEVPIATI